MRGASAQAWDHLHLRPDPYLFDLCSLWSSQRSRRSHGAGSRQWVDSTYRTVNSNVLDRRWYLSEPRGLSHRIQDECRVPHKIKRIEEPAEGKVCRTQNSPQNLGTKGRTHSQDKPLIHWKRDRQNVTCSWPPFWRGRQMDRLSALKAR